MIPLPVNLVCYKPPCCYINSKLVLFFLFNVSFNEKLSFDVISNFSFSF